MTTFTELARKSSIGSGVNWQSPIFNTVDGGEIWVVVQGGNATEFGIASNDGGWTFNNNTSIGPSGSYNYRLQIFRAINILGQLGRTVTVSSAAGDGYDACVFQIEGTFSEVQNCLYSGASGEPITVGTLGVPATTGNLSLLFVGMNEDGSNTTTFGTGAYAVAGWSVASCNVWATRNDYYGINVLKRTDFVGNLVQIDNYATTPSWGMGALFELQDVGGSPTGLVSGSTSWVGSSNGITANEGLIVGVVSWVGTISGVVSNKGDVSGLNTYLGSVTGNANRFGETTGTILLSGIIVGNVIKHGAVSEFVYLSGLVNGSTVYYGSGSGSIDFSCVVNGIINTTGNVFGSLGWVGLVIGETPLDGFNGAIFGANVWVGSITGVYKPKGNISSLIDWFGISNGEAPVVGINEGTVVGSFMWFGSTFGSISHAGFIVGVIIRVGSVIALFTVDPSIFMVSPHVVGHKPRIIVNYKPVITKGVDGG